LLNSTDSSQGADRKNEQYWEDVVRTYNETTPGNRKRNLKQAKDRWHKINRWTDLFNDACIKAKKNSLVNTMSKCGLRRLMSST
jgi:hypothetical protein